MAVADMNHLEAAIDSLMPYVATTTSMILSSAITWGPVRPREGSREKKRSKQRKAKPRNLR